jgi:ribose-phosphate pyrophosphokinase
MIIINGYKVTPTIFPDGTSQVWKLSTEINQYHDLYVRWDFESEREIIDLYSLRALFPESRMYLFIPYLPYARQDKDITNDSTFNFHVFAQLINNLKFNEVTSIDVHNSKLFRIEYDNAYSLYPEQFHNYTIKQFNPDYIVFPDRSASIRYNNSRFLKSIICDKTREQSTGKILNYSVKFPFSYKTNSRLLIVDDICDGGATFIECAKLLRRTDPNATIGLAVTHGIFSKGRDHLLDNGIDQIFTTNSLIKNFDGFKI